MRKDLKWGFGDIMFATNVVENNDLVLINPDMVGIA